jgi:putative NADH-flavin reductase
MSELAILLVFLAYAVVLTVLLARAGHHSTVTTPSSAAGPAVARVLIIGGTGGTGRRLVAQALERGLAVTALVRDPARLRVDHPRLIVVQGDVRDAAAVDAAMGGQHAVLCALGHKRFLGPSSILSVGTRNILRTMSAHGVRRLVCETSLGIGDSAGRLGLLYTFFTIPVVLPFYFWDKTRQERAIAASDVDWVVVRPGVLTNGERRGALRHAPRVVDYLWSPRISRADVAAFMLDQLEPSTPLRVAVGVCQR